MKFQILLIITLSFTGATFAQMSPGARDHFGLAYDSDRNVVVLYGGNDVNTDGKYIWDPSTWEWNNGNWNWKLMDTSSPGSISSHGFVYDPSIKKIISIGGITSQYEDLSSTWLWNGSDWLEHSGSNTGIRLSPAITYDPVREEVVLFSGCVGNNYPSDTWAFRNNNWFQLSKTGPEGVCRGALFFDEVRNAIVLFGGSKGSGNNRTNDMWEWKGEKWTEIDQGNIKPSPRSNILIAYDKKRNKAVLFGGSTEQGISDQLWEWDGNTWQHIEKSGTWPGPKEVYGVIYHKKMEKVLLYGGRSAFAKPESDFWSWDGTTWKLIHE